MRRTLSVVLAVLLFLFVYTEYCALSGIKGGAGACRLPWAWLLNVSHWAEESDSRAADASTKALVRTPEDE
jgi:hypothetical protein